MELSSKVPLMKDHEKASTNENVCLWNQIVVLNVDKGRGEGLESSDKRVVTDANVGLANVK